MQELWQDNILANFNGGLLPGFPPVRSGTVFGEHVYSQAELPVQGVQRKAVRSCIVHHQPHERAFLLEVMVWGTCIKDGLRVAK